MQAPERQREYMTLRELIDYTRFSRHTIYRAIADGKLPKPVKLTPGGKNLFILSEVDEALGRLAKNRV